MNQGIRWLNQNADITWTTIEDPDLKFQIKIWMMIINIKVMLDIPEFVNLMLLTPVMWTQT